MALRAGPGTIRLMCALARGRASRHAASVHRRLMAHCGHVVQRPQIRRGEIGESPTSGL